MSSWTKRVGSDESKVRHAPDQSNRPVLVIDDDPFARRLIQFVLNSRGLSVDLAGDGDHGLTRARSRRPAVVLLDLTLPDVDGEEIAREIQAIYGASVPIVLMGAADDVELAACRLDVERGLAKPVSWETILDAVQLAVDQPQAA